jgi:hypothetical protein
MDRIAARAGLGVSLVALLGAALLGCGGGGTSPGCEGSACADAGGGGGGSGHDGGTTDLDASFLTDSAPGDDAAPACQDFVFPFTETQETFTAPATAQWMHVKAWGAGGNGEKDCNGGMGGYAEAVYAVTPGQALIVIVGGAGSAGQMFDYRFGWGNSGGGGLSGVFTGAALVDENAWDRALVIAGGGGGDGVEKGGGPCITAIPGNHAQAGGSPTMMGGTGLDSGVNGGGGGYRGGLGGAKGAAGTGGTGFPDPQAATKPAGWVDSYLASATVGDAKPPRAIDAEYDGHAGQTEANGQVVIHFVCEKPVIPAPN